MKDMIMRGIIGFMIVIFCVGLWLDVKAREKRDD